ncbi:MAG: AMP-binding protein, partial [Burkholderiales bacterium]|nr:AMP-binding protein [Burkholderiales bacterium]
LPAPDFATASRREARTPQEALLCDLFAEVLGLDRVSPDDGFFDLGGHSLLAARLVARLRAVLGVEIPIRALFDAPSPAQMALHLDGAAAARPALRPKLRPADIPLSFAQRRLWFLAQFEGSGPLYNIPLALRLDGTLDHTALAAALADLTNRHESLRTLLADGPLQHILDPDKARPDLPLVDVAEAELPASLELAARHGFDLARDLPLRATLFRIHPEQHVLLLLLHHAAGDGWSLAPLLRDLGQAYSARLQAQAPAWTPLPVQYADYTLWQRDLLGDETDPDSEIARQRAFWQHTLAGLPEEIPLPADRPRPARSSQRGDTLPFALDPDLHGRLLALARDAGATLFMVLQAGLAALLSRLGAGADIPLGTAIAGRTDPALDDLVGLFVNTLVLRTDTSGNPAFSDLLARVRAADLAAYQHQDLPFERLVEFLNPARSPARHPLFQVMLALQNTAEPSLHLPGLAAAPLPVGTGTTKFDLTFGFTEQRAPDGAPLGLLAQVEFACDLFDRATVEILAQRLVRLLDAIAADPARRIGSIDLLDPDERRRILVEWNDTARPIPDTTLPQLFEAQCARTPDATALVFEDQTLSYAELNARANRLAHHLIALGAGPEILVGLCLDRSVELMVGLVAILKAGAAYLPLDPAYPAERLAFMLRDADPRLVLTTGNARRALPGTAPLLRLDDPALLHLLDQTPDTNPTHTERTLRPHHPAYVIYTSGSTGTPKGVV